MPDNNLYFVKILSLDDTLRSYVLFCALVNQQTSKVEGYDAVVCLSPDYLDTPEYATFRDVSNKIQRMKFEGDVAMGATSMLIESLKSSFASENYMIELLHYLEHDEHEKLEKLFKTNISQAIGSNGNPRIKVLTHLVSKDEAELTAGGSTEKSDVGKNTSSDVEKSSTPTFLVPSDALLAKYNFVLSPVSGKRLDELKLGDRVLIKVLPEDETSKNIINLLTLRDEAGMIKNVPASIVSIVKQDDGFEVIVKISDGIYGKYLEEESTIKVKMAGEETLAAVIKEDEGRLVMDDKDKNGDIEEIKTRNTGLFLSIAVVIILIWIVVIFFVL
jgi:hypothetical protein